MFPQTMPKHLEAQASIRVDSSRAILAALAAIVRPARRKPDHENVDGVVSSDDNGHRDPEAARLLAGIDQTHSSFRGTPNGSAQGAAR